jgi:hypothetical protein
LSENYVNGKEIGLIWNNTEIYPVAFLFNFGAVDSVVCAQLFYKPSSKKVKMVVHSKTQSNLYCFTDFVALRYAIYYFSCIGTVAQQDSQCFSELRTLLADAMAVLQKVDSKTLQKHQQDIKFLQQIISIVGVSPPSAPKLADVNVQTFISDTK